MEKKIKHLEMVETVIDRMSQNSFMLKGWAITLLVGIFALSAQAADQRYILIVYVPLFTFWFLDSFYLQLERKYKILYKEILKTKENDIDFNMDTNIFSKIIIKEEKLNYYKCFFSLTELLFYFPIIVAVTKLICILLGSEITNIDLTIGN